MIIDPAVWKHPPGAGFVVFEGINGGGKSTLLKGAGAALTKGGKRVVETREPGGTELGAILRSLVQETPHLTPDPLTELFLFTADRSEHVRKVIRPALRGGSWVLSDRYFYSSIVFQGFGRGMDRKMIEDVTSLAVDDVIPSLVVLVDIAPEEALNRLSARDGRDIGVKDRFEREGIDFHTRIREGFITLANERTEPFLVLDGMKPREELLLQTLSAVGARDGA